MSGGEVGEACLVHLRFVQAHKLAEELLVGLRDRLRRVRIGGRRAPDPSHRQPFKSSLTSATGSPPRSISWTIALPTTAASAIPRSAFMCSAREIPKPAPIGSFVWRRTCANRSFIPGGSSFLAPLIPDTVTQ